MNVSERQAPLRAKYRAAPVEAMVIDRAITTGIAPGDPVHCEVMPMPDRNVVVPIGVHRCRRATRCTYTGGFALCGVSLLHGLDT
jgi:hypothetical protein